MLMPCETGTGALLHWGSCRDHTATWHSLSPSLPRVDLALERWQGEAKQGTGLCRCPHGGCHPRTAPRAATR